MKVLILVCVALIVFLPIACRQVAPFSPTDGQVSVKTTIEERAKAKDFVTASDATIVSGTDTVVVNIAAGIRGNGLGGEMTITTSTRFTFTSTEIVGYTISEKDANERTIVAVGFADGVEATATVTVVDNGEPAFRDIVSLTVIAADQTVLLQAAGVLIAGNIQVHAQKRDRIDPIPLPGELDKVAICHNEEPDSLGVVRSHVIVVAPQAVRAHFSNHGDCLALETAVAGDSCDCLTPTP